MNQFTYQGYMSKEAQEFFHDHLIQEQREGLAVIGYWVKTVDGNTHMLERGLTFIKDTKGIHLLMKPQ